MDRLFFHRLGSRLKCLVLLDHNESYNTEASLRVVFFFFFSHAAYWFLLLAFFANVKIFFLPLLEERQKFWGLTCNKRLWLCFNEGCSDLAPALQTHILLIHCTLYTEQKLCRARLELVRFLGWLMIYFCVHYFFLYSTQYTVVAMTLSGFISTC